MPALRPLLRPTAALLLASLLATVVCAQQSGLKIKEINSRAPIKNFRLPTFAPEGWRDLMIRAAEARVISPERIEVSDMTLIAYTNDIINQPETTVTSPLAVALPSANRVEGTDTVHVKRADVELTGRDWSYDHTAKKITIGADAHVILQTQIENLLQ